MADTTSVLDIEALARELYRIHDEFEGVCLSCYLGHEAHEAFPCPTIRAFEAWREGLR